MMPSSLTAIQHAMNKQYQLREAMQNRADGEQVSTVVLLSGITRICTLCPQHFADNNIYSCS
jgi:hypothetical protein